MDKERDEGCSRGLFWYSTWLFFLANSSYVLLDRANKSAQTSIFSPFWALVIHMAVTIMFASMKGHVSGL